MDENFGRTLANITLAPYIVKATALIGIKRRSGSNMFRHQISTLAILLDYKFIEPVLLKAAVIHDLFEDAPSCRGDRGGSRSSTRRAEVFRLVMEVTLRSTNGIEEPKSEFAADLARAATTPGC
jgi:GTP pyrophosphokinase